MDFDIQISGYNTIQFSEEFPESLSQYLIHGSRVYSFTDSFGTLCIQHLDVPDFHGWFTVIECNRNIRMWFNKPGPHLQVRLVLSGDMDWQYKKLGEIALPANHCNLYYFSSCEAQVDLKRGMSYVFFDVIIPLFRLFPMQDYFPVLREFVERIRSNLTCTFLPGGMIIPHQAKELVEVITCFRHEKKSFALVGRQLVVNLLFILLMKASDYVGPSPITISEAAKSMHQVEQWIRSDIANSPDMDVIASRLAIGKSKLLKDFKRMFGMPPGYYWRRVRMQRALELLQESRKSIKEIAALIGFSSDSSFIAAFKEHFDNVTPAEWRAKFSSSKSIRT